MKSFQQGRQGSAFDLVNRGKVNIVMEYLPEFNLSANVYFVITQEENKAIYDIEKVGKLAITIENKEVCVNVCETENKYLLNYIFTSLEHIYFKHLGKGIERWHIIPDSKLIEIAIKRGYKVTGQSYIYRHQRRKVIENELAKLLTPNHETHFPIK